uniref:Uncharacterized protein n=1 Tax=Tetranychus urticae TaxID=32264 RepID=T1K3D6_TETUR
MGSMLLNMKSGGETEKGYSIEIETCQDWKDYQSDTSLWKSIHSFVQIKADSGFCFMV